MSIIDVTARYPLASVWWRGTYTSSAITDIVLHHTVTGELSVNASQDDELAVLDCIYTFHVNARGFGGIGYHGIAFPSGRAYLACPLHRWGAHVANENNHLWGFAAAGDYTNGVPPEGTLRGLGKLIALADKTRAVTLPLRPHLKWGGTSCPGKRWQEWVPNLRNFIAEEDVMAKLDNEDREWLAGLMRGVVWAVTDGSMNAAMKVGDPGWRPPRSLRDVQSAISHITVESNLSEVQIEAAMERVLKRNKWVVE